MRARIHLIGTDRVVWREGGEAETLVATGDAEYTEERTASVPPEKKALPPGNGTRAPRRSQIRKTEAKGGER